MARGWPLGRKGGHAWLLFAAILFVSLLTPTATWGAKDERVVYVLYCGDPFLGITPYLAYKEDAVVSVDPVRCYYHDGGLTSITAVHRFMRLYMPRNEKEYLDRYDVVLLSDAYRRAFTFSQLQWFADSVTDLGFGLSMVAGMDSYGASSSRPDASWAGSVIEEILPVEIPPQQYHHNWIQPYVNPAGARIDITDYSNEFIASLPLQPAPRYTWASNGQIVREKQGSDVMARWVLPGFNNPPCYSTWMAGKGRTFSMLHDWSGSHEFSRWDYYGDFAINLVLYLAQRALPEDHAVTHRYRSNVRTLSIGKSTILSLVYFVETFGGNTGRIDEQLGDLDGMVANAGESYLNDDIVVALADSEAALEKLKAIEEFSVKVKNQALLWVYVVEWLSVTGVSLLSGMVVWTLMVRRRLYQEVGATRLRKIDSE